MTQDNRNQGQSSMRLRILSNSANSFPFSTTNQTSSAQDKKQIMDMPEPRAVGRRRRRRRNRPSAPTPEQPEQENNEEVSRLSLLFAAWLQNVVNVLAAAVHVYHRVDHVRVSRPRLLLAGVLQIIANILAAIVYVNYGQDHVHTQATATKLGLVGWVQNTSAGTVIGCVEGPDDKVKQMKRWLQEKGSPKSRIEKCEFSEEKKIQSKNFSDFSISR